MLKRNRQELSSYSQKSSVSFFDRLSFVLDIPDDDRSDILVNLGNITMDRDYSVIGSRGLPYLYKHNYQLSLPPEEDEFSRIYRSSVLVSLSPIKSRNAGFLRVELNPAKFSLESRDTLRQFLIKLLGKKHAFRIYDEARITRYDVAVDFHGMTLDDIWILPERSRHIGVYYGKDGLKETLYYGSAESDFSSVAYDKISEVFKEDMTCAKEYPDRVRFEIRIKPDNVRLSTLIHSHNPFKKVGVYKAMTYSSLFDDCFFAACKPAGFFGALKSSDKNAQRRIKRIVKRHGKKLIDPKKAWELNQNSLNWTINLLKPKKVKKVKK